MTKGNTHYLERFQIWNSRFPKFLNNMVCFYAIFGLSSSLPNVAARGFFPTEGVRTGRFLGCLDMVDLG